MWLILLCMLVNIIVTSSNQYAPVIKIKNGKIRGLAETLSTGDEIHKYLGIPYARAERFENPLPPKKWTGVKDTTSLGKVCFQRENKDEGYTLKQMSERCLNLNVYVPINHTMNHSLPVMVWIHGGSFQSGSNKLSNNIGFLATLGKVIVVSFNYRLGKFGFLASSDYGLQGNYAFFDQLEALKWVKANIAKFGGNPKKVTLFGSSAGGSSVSFLCLSPLAKDLFNNAIMQSGTANIDILYTTYAGKDEFKKFAKDKWNCTDDANIKKCLKLKTPKEIMNAWAYELKSLDTPVIDGHFLPDDPKVLLKNGQFPNPRDTLLGVADDDGSCFTQAVPKLSIGYRIQDGLTRSKFLSYAKTFGLWTSTLPPTDNTTNVSKFEKSYYEAWVCRYTDWKNINDTNRNRRMMLDAFTDSVFLAPAIAYADAFAKTTGKNGSNIFFYRTEYGLNMSKLFPVPNWVNAFHETTKFMVFGFPLEDDMHSRDAIISRQVIKMWSNFAKTGDPNSPDPIGSVVWPQYDHQKQQYLAIKPQMQVKSKIRRAYVDFWNKEIPNLTVVPKPCTLNKNKIEFVDAYAIQFTGPPWEGEYGMMECYIDGHYTKHNCNWPAGRPATPRNTPQAFSHFTYWFTGGKELVCDIQGVNDTYTDPQIHSLDTEQYGQGNCGPDGIQSFLDHHLCSQMCKALQLPPTRSAATPNANMGTVPNYFALIIEQFLKRD